MSKGKHLFLVLPFVFSLNNDDSLALVKSTSLKKTFSIKTTDNSLQLTCTQNCKITLNEPTKSSKNQIQFGFGNSVIFIIKHESDQKIFKKIWPKGLSFQSKSGRETLSPNNERLFFLPEINLNVLLNSVEISIAPKF